MHAENDFDFGERIPPARRIHLIQRGIARLTQLFPGAGIRQSDIDEYNEQTWQRIEYIRDFIVLHLHVSIARQRLRHRRRVS